MDHRLFIASWNDCLENLEKVYEPNNIYGIIKYFIEFHKVKNKSGKKK